MKVLFQVLSGLAGLTISNTCTFYLGFEAGKNSCKDGNISLLDSLKKDYK